MKYGKVILATILICAVFSSCGIFDYEEEFFGFDPDAFIVVDQQDSHGGFHGDGQLYLILDCSENPEQARELVVDWKPFPLSDTLQLAMYADNGYKFAEDAHWPVIENGVYKFVDRNSESKNPSDDTQLLDRYSLNFTIAAYDLDTNTLYYFEIDT